MPTSYAAPPLSRVLARAQEPPPVWPDEEGEVRGYEFSPLYKSVPFCRRRDAKLYELLALVDAIRGGAMREREVAIRELRARLGTQLRGAGCWPSRRAKRAAVEGQLQANSRRGSHGQESRRLYRRRHRDS